MKNLTTETKAIYLIIIFLLIAGIASAQNAPTYRIEGDSIVKIETAAKAKAAPEVTQYTHTIKGIKYKVYRGSKGGIFIYRTSKKSGKEYKQYLKIK